MTEPRIDEAHEGPIERETAAPTDPRGDVLSASVDATHDPEVGPPKARGLVIALVAVIVATGFFAAYAYAAKSAPGVAAGSGGVGECDSGTAEADACGTGEESCGGACEGTAGGAEAPVARAALEGGIQRISVDVSEGYFDPTVIELAAGVPAEIVFGEGEGCLAEVQFPQFGIREDLTAGGATVYIPALEAGEYPFSCGMEMVYGALVVR